MRILCTPVGKYLKEETVLSTDTSKKSGALVNIIRYSGVYIGAVIGAGFASGQEALQFFCFTWFYEFSWSSHRNRLVCMVRNLIYGSGV